MYFCSCGCRRFRQMYLILHVSRRGWTVASASEPFPSHLQRIWTVIILVQVQGPPVHHRSNMVATRATDCNHVFLGEAEGQHDGAHLRQNTSENC